MVFGASHSSSLAETMILFDFRRHKQSKYNCILDKIAI